MDSMKILPKDMLGNIFLLLFWQKNCYILQCSLQLSIKCSTASAGLKINSLNTRDICQATIQQNNGRTVSTLTTQSLSTYIHSYKAYLNRILSKRP